MSLVIIDVAIDTFSPGLKGAKPKYGQDPHLKASPKWHCRMVDIKTKTLRYEQHIEKKIAE